MRSAGAGRELWRVRVDLFVDRDDAALVGAAAGALGELLAGTAEPADLGIDQGTGIAGRPVLGLTFWVHADDVGDAARVAVDTASRAAGVDPSVLYDVTVIPRAAVALPGDPGYPPLPD